MRLVPRPEDPLDRLLGEVRGELQARADRGGRVRDFADVMARAHRIDPAVTDAVAVREAARYAPVVALPGMKRARAEARPRSRIGWLLGLAAALLVGVALGGSVREARREEGAASASAVQLAAEGAARGVAAVREQPMHRGVREGGSCPVEAFAVAETEIRGEDDRGEVVLGEDDEWMRDARDEGESPETSHRGEDARRGGGDEPLEKKSTPGEGEYLRIDRDADAAWRRGDRRRARALLEGLTRSEASARLVEAAYGDLGVLIRQEGDERGLARLWRRYLARFPRGTFADDARAELCRGAGDRVTCWDRYLRSSPRGAHVEEARGAIEDNAGMLVMPGAPDVTPVQTPALRVKE